MNVFLTYTTTFQHLDYIHAKHQIVVAQSEWGNRMSYTAWSTPNTQVSFPFSRGFTGHEHYDRFKIVNANARLYDPVIGRFFSPDPFVQTPDFTQSFNRYSYCMNNPVMYSDPDGKFIVVDSWIIGFLYKFSETGSLKQAWDEANHRAGNDAKIWEGLFVTDPNKSFWGRTWELVSRFTWQLPQTLLGWTFSQTKNILGFVDRVDYLGGATFLTNEDWKRTGGQGVTIGNYINIDIHNKIDGDFTDYVIQNQLFMHEYGHYIQSQHWGPLYLCPLALSSLNSALNNAKIPDDPYLATTHDYYWTEYNANRKAAHYFNLYYDVQWDEGKGYPFDDYLHQKQ